jgi:hypothetical protein
MISLNPSRYRDVHTLKTPEVPEQQLRDSHNTALSAFMTRLETMGLWLLRMARRIRRLPELPKLIKFYFYHKLVFGITNTKFDISYIVFRESFLDDQYEIRKFVDRLGACKELLFLDIGRNHGLVFYYTVFYLIKHNIRIPVINYYGIDPSPLKFVYFNLHKELAEKGIRINYHLIDRAVVFNDEHTVALKYGEHNCGNFNVSGSNYETKHRSQQSAYEYVEISVETIQFSELLEILERNAGSDAVVIKIDCKNRTDYMFSKFLSILSQRNINYLISCERDGSSERDVSRYVKNDGVLTVSSVVSQSR